MPPLVSTIAPAACKIAVRVGADAQCDRGGTIHTDTMIIAATVIVRVGIQRSPPCPPRAPVQHENGGISAYIAPGSPGVASPMTPRSPSFKAEIAGERGGLWATN